MKVILSICFVFKRHFKHAHDIATKQITRETLPVLQDIYSTGCHRKAKKIMKDLSHSLITRYHPEGEVSGGVSKLGPRD
jgi:hypothetical protein